MTNYYGISCAYLENVIFKKIKINNCTYPIRFSQGLRNSCIEDCDIEGSTSTTGILFMGNKLHSYLNNKIRCNTVRNVREESISFDIIGNNYQNSPKIFELAITKIENVSYEEKECKKIYVKARKVISDAHDTEDVLDITSAEIDLEDTFFEFSCDFGGSESGNYYKILSYGKDDTDNYFIINNGNKDITGISYFTGEEVEEEEIKNKYFVAEMVLGFVNNEISGNRIINGIGGTIVLWGGSFGNIISHNIDLNCKSGYSVQSGPYVGTNTYSYRNIFVGNITNQMGFGKSTFGKLTRSLRNCLVGNIIGKLSLNNEQELGYSGNIVEELIKENTVTLNKNNDILVE